MQPVKKTDAFILSKKQWLKVFLAMSILIIAIYSVAMVFSLCGSKYFILNYQNAQMDHIEAFMKEYKIMALINDVFMTLEFCIIATFIRKKLPQWYFVLVFYVLPLIPYFIFKHLPSWFYTLYPFAVYLPLIFIGKKSDIPSKLIRFLIAIAVSALLQLIILVIKAGYFDGVNHVMNLSATFIYAVEYDIALSVMLYTGALLLDREKGDSKVWTTSQPLGGSSQISKTQSLKSNTKNLTKAQKNRLWWLYAKTYLIQLGTLLLVLVLPFLLGKVFEFIVLYLAFAITRYILGFQYSLHFKKEALCVSASLIVFGILALAVPFFYAVIVIAIAMGCSLAIGLHLSYKYKSLWLYNEVAKSDKFATLYVFFDGDLSEYHIKIICGHKGLNHFQSSLIYNFMRGEKMSVLAHKFNYSQRMIIYKLDEAIDKLLA